MIFYVHLKNQNFNFFFFFSGFLTWSVSIVELVQLIESKAFSILQFLSNSIQEIIDSSPDLGPESKARLEELCFDPIRVPNTAFGISLRYAGKYKFKNYFQR